VHVTPRVGTSWEDDLYRSRLGSATGLAPLAIPVHDLLAAHAALRLRGDVDPARIAWLGIGAGGPAVLAAAVLVGEGGPVALAHAPVTLWFDGPGQDLADGRRGPRRWVREPFHPWPATLLVGAEGGIAADPWHLAHALHGRLRWLDPRGGDGGPWSEHLPWGRVVESLPELLDDREPANPPPPAP
jgi:hypothetical protein